MDLFDMIGPVMIGPSSSHTAGAARIGRTALMILGEPVLEANIVFHGSFAKTAHGHGTDRAIVGGLIGMLPDDSGIRESFQIAEERGLKLTFGTTNIRGAHPNTVRLKLVGQSGKKLELDAASVGGGQISVCKLDGFEVDFSGKENTLIIHHLDETGVIAAVAFCLSSHHINIGNMQDYRQKAGAEAMMILQLDSVPQELLINQIKGLPDVLSVQLLQGRVN